MATDTELYEEQLNAGYDPSKNKGDPAPDFTELDTQTSLLMAIHELLQTNLHFVSKQKGKPKVERLPRPKTAQQLYERRKAREASEFIESMIQFVPRERYRETANIREAQSYGDVLRR